MSFRDEIHHAIVKKTENDFGTKKNLVNWHNILGLRIFGKFPINPFFRAHLGTECDKSVPNIFRYLNILGTHNYSDIRSYQFCLYEYIRTFVRVHFFKQLYLEIHLCRNSYECHTLPWNLVCLCIHRYCIHDSRQFKVFRNSQTFQWTLSPFHWYAGFDVVLYDL